MMIQKNKIMTFIILAFVILLSIDTSNARSRSNDIRAAYLYRISSYTTWPSIPKNFNICISGGSRALLKSMQTLTKRKIKGRAIIVKRLGGNCQVIFTPSNSRHLISKYAKQPVLLVGGASGFAKAGGQINFYLSKRKLRFQVNTLAVRNSGLRLSSRLLRLADIVILSGPSSESGQG